jgi:hypothetical protein
MREVLWRWVRRSCAAGSRESVALLAPLLSRAGRASMEFGDPEAASAFIVLALLTMRRSGSVGHATRTLQPTMLAPRYTLCQTRFLRPSLRSALRSSKLVSHSFSPAVMVNGNEMSVSGTEDATLEQTWGSQRRRALTARRLTWLSLAF